MATASPVNHEPPAVARVGAALAATPVAVRAEAPTAAPRPEAQAAGSGARGRKICPGCHRFNAAAAAFCADCGVALPKDTAVPLFGGPAGFWIRVVAFTIDQLLLYAAHTFAAARLGLKEVDYDRLAFAEALVRDLPSIALYAAIACTYAMVMVGTWGGTLGKLILGLRIVRHSDGGKVPYGLALGRSLAEYVSALAVGLGYLWIGLSPSKRGWHDYLCDTRVVYAKPE